MTGQFWLGVIGEFAQDSDQFAGVQRGQACL